MKKEKKIFEFDSVYAGLDEETIKLLREDVVDIAKMFKVQVHTMERIETGKSVFTVSFSGKKYLNLISAIGALEMQKKSIMETLKESRNAKKVGA